jgi:cytochrome P450
MDQAAPGATATPEGSTPNAQGKPVGRCPVFHTDYRNDRPAFETWALLNEEREAAEGAWNDSTNDGFWVVNRFDDVKEALSMHEEFNNDSTSAFISNPRGKLLPQNLNQPEHAKLRKVLNPFFSPAAVKRISPLARERAIALVEEIAPKGGLDMASEFAMIYPTELFLALLGLPVEDGQLLLPWVEDMFLGFFNEDEESVALATAAVRRINAYFAEAVEQRQAELRDPETDLVSRLLTAEIDGEPIPRRDVITICTTLMAAGLDTTRSVLGYVFHHLANDDELRRRVVEDPDLWPRAIEESVRLYTLIIQDGRKVSRDMEWKGMDMKAGDMLWIGLAGANRDPRKFEDPDTFDMDRPNVNQHIGFGAGHHRCIGMHLARAELVIALEEWHKRIPDYRVATDEQLMERGGQVRLQSLPLAWD